MKIEENEVYTTKDLTEILKVSMPTIKRMLRDKKLASIRIGRQHRFLGSDILALLSLRQQTALAVRPPEEQAAPTQQIIYLQCPTGSPAGLPGLQIGAGQPMNVPAEQIAKSVPGQSALSAAFRNPPHPRFGMQEPPIEAAAGTVNTSQTDAGEEPEIDITERQGEPGRSQDVQGAPKLPTYEQTLSTAELRQRAYMLGKYLLKDIFDGDGNLLFEQGCVVTDLMIETSRRKHKFMDLFAAIEHSD